MPGNAIAARTPNDLGKNREVLFVRPVQATAVFVKENVSGTAAVVSMRTCPVDTMHTVGRLSARKDFHCDAELRQEAHCVYEIAFEGLATDGSLVLVDQPVLCLRGFRQGIGLDRFGRGQAIGAENRYVFPINFGGVEGHDVRSHLLRGARPAPGINFGGY